MKAFMLVLSRHGELSKRISVKTSMFIKSGFVDNRLIIVDHANSFAPLMDAVCPRRFLIECVDAK